MQLVKILTSIPDVFLQWMNQKNEKDRKFYVLYPRTSRWSILPTCISILQSKRWSVLHYAWALKNLSRKQNMWRLMRSWNFCENYQSVCSADAAIFTENSFWYTIVLVSRPNRHTICESGANHCKDLRRGAWSFLYNLEFNEIKAKFFFLY